MATEQTSSGKRPPSRPDPRTIRRASLAALLAAVGGLVLAYFLVPAFRAEIDRAGETCGRATPTPSATTCAATASGRRRSPSA